MSYDRPIVLSLAGFDSCGGAGVIADIKTFEQHQCLGMAVNTSITNQVEDNFISVNWFSAQQIIAHIKPLTDRYQIDYVKIGIIEKLGTLHEVVNFLKEHNKNVKIIWDTVLSASTGFNLMEDIDPNKLQDVLKKMYLITPNVNEANKLSRTTNERDAAKFLSGFCNVLLKGGHSEEHLGIDFLFTGNEIIEIKKQSSKTIYQKHGSGCVLSSAIVANLALDHDLKSSCQKAKQYTETILNSNTNLLAYHVA